MKPEETKGHASKVEICARIEIREPPGAWRFLQGEGTDLASLRLPAR